MNLQHLYLSFAGRTSKRNFWIGLGGLLVGGIVAGLLPIIGPALSLALLYPSIALMAKRLHDFGRSAWLIAIPLVPAVLAAVTTILAASAVGNPTAIGAALAAAGLAILLSAVAMVTGLAFLVWAGVRDGDAGINTYGEPNDDAVLP